MRHRLSLIVPSRAVAVAFAALLASNTIAAMSLLAVTMFLLFLSTGPINTLIIESVPVNLRASAMALSIFMIHLFGDMWSPEIVGRLADGVPRDAETVCEFDLLWQEEAFPELLHADQLTEVIFHLDVKG